MILDERYCRVVDSESDAKAKLYFVSMMLKLMAGSMLMAKAKLPEAEAPATFMPKPSLSPSIPTEASQYCSGRFLPDCPARQGLILAGWLDVCHV